MKRTQDVFLLGYEAGFKAGNEDGDENNPCNGAAHVFRNGGMPPDKDLFAQAYQKGYERGYRAGCKEFWDGFDE